MNARIKKAITTLVALLAASCCSRNIVLQRSPGDFTGVIGDLQRCDPGQTPCAPDKTYNTSVFNSSNTTYLAMPKCSFGINRLMLQNSGSGSAVAIVECAAEGQAAALPDGGMPTMGGTAGASH